MIQTSWQLNSIFHYHEQLECQQSSNICAYEAQNVNLGQIDLSLSLSVRCELCRVNLHFPPLPACVQSYLLCPTVNRISVSVVCGYIKALKRCQGSLSVKSRWKKGKRENDLQADSRFSIVRGVRVYVCRFVRRLEMNRGDKPMRLKCMAERGFCCHCVCVFGGSYVNQVRGPGRLLSRAAEPVLSRCQKSDVSVL